MDFRIYIKPIAVCLISLIGPLLLPNAWGILLAIIIGLVADWFIPSPDPQVNALDAAAKDKLTHMDFGNESPKEVTQGFYGSIIFVLNLMVSFGLYFAFGFSPFVAVIFMYVVAFIGRRLILKIQ